MLTREEITYLFRLMRDDALPEQNPERPGQPEPSNQTDFPLQAAQLLGAGTAPLPPKPVAKRP